MTAVTASIVGLKDSKPDLRRHSPEILPASISLLIIAFGIIIKVPLIQEEKIDKKVKAPPLIIQLKHFYEKYNANNFRVKLTMGA